MQHLINNKLWQTASLNLSRIIEKVSGLSAVIIANFAFKRGLRRAINIILGILDIKCNFGYKMSLIQTEVSYKIEVVFKRSHSSKKIAIRGQLYCSIKKCNKISLNVMQYCLSLSLGIHCTYLTRATCHGHE